MIPVGLLGVDRLLVRDLTVYRAQGDLARRHGLWRWSNLAAVTASAVVVAAGWPALLWLRGRLAGEQIVTLQVGLLSVPFLTLTLVRQAALQAEGHSLAGQLPERIARPVLVAVLCLLLFLVQHARLEAPWAAAAFVAASAVTLALSHDLLVRFGTTMRAERTVVEGRRWAQSGVRFMVGTLLAVAGEQMSLLLVGVFAGATAVGTYSVGVNGGRLVALGLLALNVPLAPIVARLHADGNRAALKALVRKGRRVVLAVTAALFLGMVLLQDVFLGAFGPDFSQARLPLLILCLGQLVNGACGPVALLLAMSNHEWEVVAAMVLNLCINLVGGLWLIPVWGPAGAAVAAAVALVAWNLYLTQRVARHLGLNLLTA